MSKPSDKQKASKKIQHKAADYDNVFSSVVELLDAARRASARVVNTLMTATYWEIGRRIVEHEQAGEKRADYGKELIQKLSRDLTQRFGRGFGVVQLSVMRQFFLTFSSTEIFQSLIEKSTGETSGGSQQPILQSVIEKSSQSAALAPIGQFNRRSSVKFARALEHLGSIARALRFTVSARRPQTEAGFLIFPAPSGAVQHSAPTIRGCGQLPPPARLPLVMR